MCLICERIAMIEQNTNKYLVKELKTGYVVVGDHQHFYGYTLFLFKRHLVELSQLDEKEKMIFLQEMSWVAEAVQLATGCEKMNYELLGNGDAHLHWHLFPRNPGDLADYGINGKGPVWWYPYEMMFDEQQKLSDEELNGLKKQLSTALDQVLNSKQKIIK